MAFSPRLRRHARAISLACLLGALPASAEAESLDDALAKAYATNPEINAQRAALRATDEQVPLAKSGQRPQLNALGSAGLEATSVDNGPQSVSRPLSLGVQARQNVFSGFRNRNAVRQAETGVLGGRATLDAVTQNVLFDTVQAYADVLQAGAILDVRRDSVGFFQQQLQASQDRFSVGEVTRTDVAQAQAGLNRGQANQSLAEGNLATARAIYARLVGEMPRDLQPIRPLGRELPSSLDAAIAISREEHPQVRAASFQSDTAQLQVKIAEADLYPTISVDGSATRTFPGIEGGSQLNPNVRDNVRIQAQLNMPLYSGGRTSAQIRQSKETLGQRLIELDLTRVQVESLVISAFAALQTSAFAVEAGRAEVAAAQSAVDGVVEEARVGQRTTLDVLEAQENVNAARIRLIQSERDQLVSSYQLLSAIGRLTPDGLGLQVRRYEPEVHYNKTRDRWFGLRTPSGN